jgi:hypothetical protein
MDRNYKKIHSTTLNYTWINHLYSRIYSRQPVIFISFAFYVENFYEYKEMVAEVKGVCKGASLSFPITMFLNFMYEFTTIKSCSGIVARNSEN